jgi:hypothetical protein
MEQMMMMGMVMEMVMEMDKIMMVIMMEGTKIYSLMKMMILIQINSKM